MEYGKHTYIETDASGNEHEIVTYFREGKAMPEKREIFEERKKVANQLEEAAQYHAFAKLYHQDPSMLNPMIAIEGKSEKSEYYYVVLTYTRKIISE